MIEIDGETHEQQHEYDAERNEYLAARGYRMLRFSTDRVIHDLDGVLTEIRAACSPSPEPGGGGWGVGAHSQRRNRQRQAEDVSSN